jgi:hypothetical protein
MCRSHTDTIVVKMAVFAEEIRALPIPIAFAL